MLKLTLLFVEAQGSFVFSILEYLLFLPTKIRLQLGSLEKSQQAEVVICDLLVSRYKKIRNKLNLELPGAAEIHYDI